MMPVRCILLAVLLILLPGPGAAPGQDRPPPAPRDEMPGNDPQQMPSLEMLEFLGEWETEEGEWIDPAEMDRIQLPDQEQEDEKEIRS